MKGLMSGAVLLSIAAVLMGCSAADNKSSNPGAAASSPMVASSTSPSGEPASAPTSAPAAGGTATDF